MMNRTGYVYTLEDPRDGRPVYVGKTVMPKHRYKQHLKNPTNEKMRVWIDELDILGLRPRMNLVRVCEERQLRRKEAIVMEQVSESFNLLNKQRPGYVERS